MDRHGFDALLERIAAAWRDGDARAAAACFAEDAVYLEPPDRQRYLGRAALYEFFGADDPPPMFMTWHNVVFDETRQVGCGEYTFRARRQYHGIVIVALRGDEISHWREYQYVSDADFPTFAGASFFASA